MENENKQLGIELTEGDQASAETLEELSNGKGEDDE